MKETEVEVKLIRKDFSNNKDGVMKMLVEKVLEVDLSIPNSIREKFLKKK